MDISCNSSSRGNPASFLLAHEVTSLISLQPLRSGVGRDLYSSIVRQSKTEQLRCLDVTFARDCYGRWKLESGCRGLDSNFKNAFNLRKCSGQFAGRRGLVCCGGKRSWSGGLEEPIGDVVSQNCKIFSSPASSLKDEETTAISTPEELISSLPMTSPFQAPAITVDSMKSRVGVLITTGHFLLACGAVLFVDYQILSNDQFWLTFPFLSSAAVTAILGYFFVPVLKYFKALQIFRIEGPTSHKAKIGTPTMGGLFFIPVGVAIAGFFTGFNSIEVQGAMLFTLASAGIGLIDDCLAFWRKHNNGLPGMVKLVMQVAVGISFFFGLEVANLPYPSKIKPVVWFPAPFGLLHLGRWYLPFSAFCCAAMSNGVNLTDGLDGLAGGTAAVAFIAMSVAVLPLCPELGVFGASMAGTCFGFLVHNRYKAKVFMGDTGSLALGGALAAMACSTGMFFPLFMASGVFVIEALSVIGQVFYFKLTKKLYGEGRRLFRMSPLHHHLELVGLKEPIIVIMAYSLSIALGLLVAYLVLGVNEGINSS